VRDPNRSRAREDLPTASFLAPLLHDPYGVAQRRWKPMAASAAIALACAALLAFQVNPLFTARTTVSVIGARISENPDPSTVRIATLDEVHAIVREVVSDTNLARVLQRHGVVAEDAGDEALELAVARARERISIEPESTAAHPQRAEPSGVYAIEFVDSDPRRAAALANELASSFVAAHLRLRNSEARVAAELLRRERAQVESELREQERIATEFKARYRSELPGELASTLARRDRLQETRRALAGQLRERAGRAPSTQRAEILEEDDPLRLATLRGRLDTALSIYTRDHPNVVALQRQVDVLERQADALEPTLAASSESVADPAEQALLQRRIEGVESELAELDAQLATGPRRHQELGEIDQRLSLLRIRRVELMRRADRAELSESVESAQRAARVAVLDRALPPTSGVGARARLLLAGVACAIALAWLIALILEEIDAVVLSGEQLEAAHSLPVLGSVPHLF